MGLVLNLLLDGVTANEVVAWRQRALVAQGH